MITRAANGSVSKSINLPLLGDMPERLESVRAVGETRVAFIRTAINNEIARRSEGEAENNRTVQGNQSR